MTAAASLLMALPALATAAPAARPDPVRPAEHRPAGRVGRRAHDRARFRHDGERLAAPGVQERGLAYSLRHVAISFTGFGESANHDDGTGTRHTYRTYTPDLRVGLPVIKGRLGLTAGFSIFRSSQFQSRVDPTWAAFGDTIYRQPPVRAGGLAVRGAPGRGLAADPGGCRWARP